MIAIGDITALIEERAGELAQCMLRMRAARLNPTDAEQCAEVAAAYMFAYLAASRLVSADADALRRRAYELADRFIDQLPDGAADPKLVRP